MTRVRATRGRANVAEAMEVASPRAIGARSPGRTYVVEDHDLVLSLLSSWFSSRGHRVEACPPSKIDALEKIDRHDLVVLDLCLGDRDGIDVLQLLSERGFHGDVILISAFPESVIETAREVGADFGVHVLGALRKPLAFDRLDALLASRHRPERNAASSQVATTSLAEALRDGRVTFWYQPIFDARTLRVVSVEMLARLGGPGETVRTFGPALAEAGADALHELARVALDDADRLTRTLVARGVEPLPIAINVPSSLLEGRLFGPILERLEAMPAPIGFEVSELDPFRDLSEARRTAMRAILRGARFSLDDFGMINSNIDRLMQIPFDELKIDRSFVDGCREVPFRDAVCRCAVDLARTRGAMVVAEGVETAGDFLHLRRLGVDRVQGYLFSRPIPAGDLVNRIAARSFDTAAFAAGEEDGALDIGGGRS